MIVPRHAPALLVSALCAPLPACDGLEPSMRPIAAAEGRSLLDLALVDADEDGDLDALALSSQGDVLRLQNDGAGAFSSAVLLQAPGARAVASADLDGDGVLDLATSGESAFVHAGLGDGSFEPEGVAVGLAHPVTIADFAAAPGLELAGIRFFDGGGALSLYAGGALVGSSEAEAVAQGQLALDVDGDDDLDLVALSAGASAARPEVRIYAGDGAGTFALGAGAECASDPSSLARAGDGARVFFACDLGVHAWDLVDGSEPSVEVQGEADLGAVTAVGVGDLDGDGRDELLVARSPRQGPLGSTGALALTMKDGTGRVREGALPGSIADIAIGDVDGDGVDEALLAIVHAGEGEGLLVVDLR